MSDPQSTAHKFVKLGAILKGQGANFVQFLGQPPLHLTLALGQTTAQVPEDSVDAVAGRIKVNDDALRLRIRYGPVIPEAVVVIVLVHSVTDTILFLVVVVTIVGDYIFIMFVHL